jgi:HTH-type transcriptional regulator / antitoxin HigA
MASSNIHAASKMGEFKPDWAVHPGAFVDEYLEVRGMDIHALATVTEIPQADLEGIVAQRASVTPEIAAKLEEAFGLKASIWLGLQSEYDAKSRSLDIGPEGSIGRS